MKTIYIFRKNYAWMNFLFFSFALFIPVFKSEGRPFDIQLKHKAKNIGHCSTDYISVHYNDSADYQSACEGAQRVEAFFEGYLNDQRKEPVQILFGDSGSFEDGKIKDLLSYAVGLYVYKKNTIVIKPWRILKDQKYLDRFPISQNLHASLVAHELSHHLHHANIKKIRWGEEALRTTLLPDLMYLKNMVEKLDHQDLKVELLSSITQFETAIANNKNMEPGMDFLKNIRELESVLEGVSINRVSGLDIEFLKAVIQIRKNLRKLLLKGNGLETEFLAAIIQLETMGEPEKIQFLNYLKDRPPSFDETNLSLLIYEFNPGTFMISAYRSYLKSPDIVQHVFNGKKIGHMDRRLYHLSYF